MSEADLQRKLDNWTDNQTADYGVLLNELAQLKLIKGEIPEAQQLFQKALSVSQQASQEANGVAEAEDDWETSWENSLPQLQSLQSSQATAKPVRQTSKPVTAAQNTKQLSEHRKASAYANDPPEEELEIPFDGLHLLECHGISQRASVLSLEGFLQQQQWQSVTPVVRPVTDTHAVVVCANPADARALLQYSQQAGSKWQFNTFSKACAQCQGLSPAELQPPKLRQRTTTAVARRLIGNALNVANVHDKAAEQQLKAQRAASQAAKVEKQRQLDATWDDD